MNDNRKKSKIERICLLFEFKFYLFTSEIFSYHILSCILHTYVKRLNFNVFFKFK